MAIYRATIKGRRKSVLLRADSAAQARDQLVEVKTLTATDMQDAIEAGESVWKPGQPFPEDEAAPEAEAEQAAEESGDKGGAEADTAGTGGRSRSRGQTTE